MTSEPAERSYGWWMRDVVVALIVIYLVVASCSYDRGLLDAFQLPKRALLVVGGLGIVTMILLCSGMRRRISLPVESLLLVTFLVLSCASVFVAHAAVQSTAPLRDVFGCAAWWLLGVLLFRRDRHVVAVLVGLVVAGTMMARLGVLQADGVVTCERIPEVAWFFKTFGIDFPKGPPLWFENVPPAPDPPGSFAGHVNMAAETVLMGFVAALGLLAVSASHVRRLGRFWPAVGVAAFLLVPAIIVQGAFLKLSGSRAAWLAGIVALSWLAFGLARRMPDPRLRRRVLLAGVGLVVVLGGALAIAAPHIEVTGRGGGREVAKVALSDRIGELFDWSEGTERERQILWGNTAAMVSAHPWLGVGAGNWKIEYPRWSTAYGAHPSDAFTLARQPERTHNDPLQVLAETGWPAFLCLLGFVGLAFVRLSRMASGADTRGRHVASAVVLAIFAVSLVAFPFQLPFTASTTFLLLGAGTIGGGVVGPAGRRVVLSGVGVAVLVVILAALTVLAAFDLNGRWKADAAYLFARQEHLASRIRVEDSGAAGKLTPRDLLQRALDRLDEATARDPSSYVYATQRAEVLWELGLGDQAFAALDRVLEQHPNLIQALLLKAELHNRLGRPEDRAAAWRLIHVEARSIMPRSPEVHYAAGQHLMMMAERFPEQADYFRIEAISQFSYAADPEVRRYAPAARLALASAMIDNGEPLPRVMQVLALAEQDASRRPGDLGRVARLYADPRLAAFGGGMFGAAGHKTQALWKRILGMTRGQDAEARMETLIAPWHAWRTSGGHAEPPDLDPMIIWIRSHLRTYPGAILARYYLALMLEDDGRIGEAVAEWRNLRRYLKRGGRISTFWKRKIEFELNEFLRRLGEAPRQMPPIPQGKK